MSKKNNDPIVDDELLKTAGAEPEEHTLSDEVEADLEDHLEEGAVADVDNMVATLEAQITEKDERHLRLYAEFENFKKRSRKEKLELMDTAGRKTMMALLPVIDDFDRAAKQAESDPDTKKVWDSGVGLIVKKMMKTLEGQGLKPMVSTGETFNADFHEAITEIPAPDMAGKVVDTVENGYFLNEKIIRHAKVVVGK
ncbi:nucleotide exchange factor GrpE [Neolewinella aurantiaca]|uniref:Protein GrpE n=1 Tax=Neolewinella aurantiaca TaxID=2602767 RepID=A0A5C7FMD3_9BACT|nr:nucleotide exchange factor GrpE [Neolewinella aurantiaca]TXF91248.1 nucleotide exchange factor GrpE [Neolewinella aurantiaca]